MPELMKKCPHCEKLFTTDFFVKSHMINAHFVLFLNSADDLTKWDADLYNYGSKGMGTSEPYWRSKNGTKRNLIDIELSHLNNIIKLIMRKDPKFKDRLIFKQLLAEQKRREDTGELW